MESEEQKPEEQKPEERIHNFNEVCFGYTKEQAIKEAKRCLQCQLPLCEKGCPAGISIKKFIKHIADEEFDLALKTILEKNSLPGICGRVCPAEEQCKKSCISRPAINIALLERFAADNAEKIAKNIKKTCKKIAVIGSGPAGLACSSDLALMGYEVVVYEALHKPGGVLTYGIPEFRLTKKIVMDEVNYIKKLGVNIKLNSVIGKLFGIDELLKKYDAVFIATGAGLPYFLGIEGENLNNVYSANEFLTRNNLMKAYKFPEYITPVKKSKKTVVIGGGNVAVDAARVAKRLGSDVTIIYRRSRKEMPGRDKEIKHAEEEGIEFRFLANPIKITGKHDVNGIECISMKLTKLDDSGRKIPMPVQGSEFKIACNQVIVAIGQGPNPLIGKTINLNTGKKGNIIADNNYQTSIKNVFAGGDITSGSATVIKAISDGKKAAKIIDEKLKRG
ncbi:MAG: glutamate synthase (NADPH), homotetrameric [Candidatus Diapherotrites archaeon CG09_land_8_20_14_0_10_32_12]|nr:MAG: glutamate synthase (NADPH), homotetrameric [Candidatus Diapherotrites archaeon CG09_land_8_20_14_0_10_32_12]